MDKKISGRTVTLEEWQRAKESYEKVEENVKKLNAGLIIADSEIRDIIIKLEAKSDLLLMASKKEHRLAVLKDLTLKPPICTAFALLLAEKTVLDPLRTINS